MEKDTPLHGMLSGHTPKLSSPLFVGWFHLSAKGQCLNQGDPLGLEPSLSELDEGRQKHRSQQKPQGLSKQQGLTSYQME